MERDIRIESFERMFRGMIKEGISPAELLVAFNNACTDENVIEEAGGILNGDETPLEEAHEGFEKGLGALRKMGF